MTAITNPTPCEGVNITRLAKLCGVSREAARKWFRQSTRWPLRPTPEAWVVGARIDTDGRPHRLSHGAQAVVPSPVALTLAATRSRTGMTAAEIGAAIDEAAELYIRALDETGTPIRYTGIVTATTTDLDRGIAAFSGPLVGLAQKRAKDQGDIR